MSQKVLNNALCRRYLTEEFGYDLRLKRMNKYLHNWKCNNITNNSKKQNSEK